MTYNYVSKYGINFNTHIDKDPKMIIILYIIHIVVGNYKLQ